MILRGRGFGVYSAQAAEMRTIRKRTQFAEILQRKPCSHRKGSVYFTTPRALVTAVACNRRRTPQIDIGQSPGELPRLGKPSGNTRQITQSSNPEALTWRHESTTTKSKARERRNRDSRLLPDSWSSGMGTVGEAVGNVERRRRGMGGTKTVISSFGKRSSAWSQGVIF